MSDKDNFLDNNALLIGIIATLVLILGIGSWSVITTIAGAVIAPGQLEVESNRQVIQHPEGGVVSEIYVRSGDSVEAGDILVRFDGRRIAADLAITESQYFEILARKARLAAERDDLDEVVFSDELLEAAKNNTEVETHIEVQNGLFNARRLSAKQEEEQLKEQTLQIEEQINGANAQMEAFNSQFAMIKEDLVDQQALEKRGLTTNERVSSLRMSAADFLGQIGSLKAELARLRAQITENKIATLRLYSTRRENANNELSDLRPTEIELTERRLQYRDSLDKLDVRAPMSGLVYNSQIHAKQGVVQAAEPMMYIIPQNQNLIVNARVNTTDIDQVYIGQDATMIFSALDQRFVPDVKGAVTNISADSFLDERTQAQYYEVEVQPNPGEMDKLAGQEVMPGMPVESFIRTSDRTPLSYLTKPLTDYFRRAFRG